VSRRQPFETRLNPFERIRSTEGKVFLLMFGLASLALAFIVWTPVAHSLGWMTAFMVSVLTYMVVGTYGTMRIVARPVRRAKAHFEAIARGDYSRPVNTRRTDEFGDMLRGLDQMRRSLTAAVEAREAAESRYREIVERSVQGFYQSNEDGDLLAANDALARLLGYRTADELLAESAGLTKRVHVDPARRVQFISLMRSQGVINGFEAALRRRDGSTIWITESARIVHDPLTKRSYLEGFLDDITERKQTEQFKSDFVSFVTHQLRTPLSGIRWMLELAKESESAGEVKSFVEDAHASAERLISLVNDLLDVTRLEAGRLAMNPTMLSLAGVTSDIVHELEPLAGSKHQTLTFSGSSPDVFADSQLLRQAVLNLVGNALKYTPEGGSVTVSVSADEADVHLSVRDTGIGISEDAQRQLFQKFYRANNAQAIDTEGTGLGLYLVRLIAEHAGGRVACQSREGTGSTFTLSLPIATSEKAVA
jgi:PAS domain S-box-containing protein